MAKPKTIYRCTECGYESAKWNGKCPSCGAWNTLEEDVPLPAQAVGNSRRKPVDLSDKIQELDEVDTTADVRYHTGVGELDRVLGGGLVRGSIVLLGGEPGIGKSTLLLQICQYFGESHSVLYVSGEESAKQIKLRAQRLGVTTRSLYLLTVTDAQSICDTISASRPNRAPALTAGAPTPVETPLSHDFTDNITSAKLQYRENSWEDWQDIQDNSDVDENDQIQAVLEYTLPPCTLSSDLNTIKYPLPEALKNFTENGIVYNSSKEAVGVGKVEGGYVSITFYDAYVQKMLKVLKSVVPWLSMAKPRK